MRVAVIVFPGSNCDTDCQYALEEVLGIKSRLVWHQETSLAGFDAVVLPGGFSYGDYLRSGAIARFSPIMAAVQDFAAAGKPVLGICNGWQILLEAGLLPGAMLRNQTLRFICRWTHIRVEREDLFFTQGLKRGEVLRIPIAHGEGNYYLDPETLQELEANRQVVFRYSTASGEVVPGANPNGSVNSIAGVCNREGNVLGMMPHPERAVEMLLGSEDGRRLLAALGRSWKEGSSCGC